MRTKKRLKNPDTIKEFDNAYRFLLGEAWYFLENSRYASDFEWDLLTYREEIVVMDLLPFERYERVIWDGFVKTYSRMLKNASLTTREVKEWKEE